METLIESPIKTQEGNRGGWRGTGKRRKDMTLDEIQAVLGKEEYDRRQAYYRQKADEELAKLETAAKLIVKVVEVSLRDSKVDHDAETGNPARVLRAHCLTNSYHLLRVSNTTEFIEFRLDGGEYGNVTHYELRGGYAAITIEIEPKVGTWIEVGDRLNLNF